jgi:hypothetical protein
MKMNLGSKEDLEFVNSLAEKGFELEVYCDGEQVCNWEEFNTKAGRVVSFKSDEKGKPITDDAGLTTDSMFVDKYT